MNKSDRISSITKNCQELFSVLDILDLDESTIDDKLQELMRRSNSQGKNFKVILSFIVYKYIISIQEETDCENSEIIEFVSRRLANVESVSDENFNILLDMFSAALCLNKENLISNAEHLLQQFLSSLNFDAGSMSPEEPSRADVVFKIVDSILNVCIENNLILNSKYLNSELDNILLKQEKFARTQLFSHTVPRIIECCQDFHILNTIWDGMITRMDCLNLNDFIIMGSLSNYYFPTESTEITVKIKSTLVKDVNFWKLIQIGFLHCDYSVRKCSIYLATRALNSASNSKSNINVMKQGDTEPIFAWNNNARKKIEDGWSNLFVLLETLEEKQSHLVLSAISLLDKLDALHCIWYNCALERALQHDTEGIKLKAIEYALKKFHSKYSLQRFPFKQLFNALNNTFLYDNACDMEGDELISILRNFLFMDGNLANVLKCMDLISWSPIPRFYMSYLLMSQTNLKADNLSIRSIVQAFVCKNSPVPNNMLIRSGIESCMINSVIRNCSETCEMDEILLIVSAIALNRNSKLWNNLRDWLKKFNNSNLAKDFCKIIYDRTVSNNLLDLRNISSIFVLLIDSNILEDEGAEMIKRMFISLKESENRDYASNSEFDINFFFIIHILNVINSANSAEISKFKESDNASEINDKIYDIIKIISCNIDVLLLYVQRCLRTTLKLEDYSKVCEYVNGIQVIIKQPEILRTINMLLDPVSSMAISVLQAKESCTVQLFFSIKIISLAVASLYKNYNNHQQEIFMKYKSMYRMTKKLDVLKFPESDDYEIKLLKGKIISEYYESISEIYYFYYLTLDTWTYNNVNELLDEIVQLLETGGHQSLIWVVKLCNLLMPRLLKLQLNINELEKVIRRIWNEIFEIRKNEKFKDCIRAFISMLFQEEIIKTKMFSKVDYLLHEYIDKLYEFGEQSPHAVYELLLHIESISKNIDLEPFLSLLNRALIFGTVPRKDQRIHIQTCNFIVSNVNKLSISSEMKYIINPTAEIRLMALKILSTQNIEIQNAVTCDLKTTAELLIKSKTRYHGNSLHHRILLRVLQGLLFSHKMRSNESSVTEIVQWCTHNLIKQPHHISVRIMLEWYIILHLIQKKIPLNDETINTLKLFELPQISQFTIIYHVVKHQIIANKMSSGLQKENNKGLGDSDNESLLLQNFSYALNTYLPHIMGQIFHIRLHAQYLTLKLFQLIDNSAYTDIYQMIYDTIVKTFQLSANEKNLKNIQNDFYINNFDVVLNLTASDIYFNIPRLTDVASEEWIPCESLNELDKQSSTVFMKNACDDNYDLSKIIIEKKTFDTAGDSLDLNEIIPIDTENINVQKKFVPWKNMLAQLGIMPKDALDSNNCSNLIVVASLIDRLPNLGGLSRTCEVFGVKQYVINNLKHLEDKQFQSLSVSSERWVNIIEKKAGNDLRDYLMEMKDQGYCIVGAEQTASSVPLNKFIFPKNCILLMGHEKEGVPCDLLNLMDFCVEIPQYGMVRSLNVHVTASVFIWEYTKQHPISKLP